MALLENSAVAVRDYSAAEDNVKNITFKRDIFEETFTCVKNVIIKQIDDVKINVLRWNSAVRMSGDYFLMRMDIERWRVQPPIYKAVLCMRRIIVLQKKLRGGDRAREKHEN